LDALPDIQPTVRALKGKVSHFRTFSPQAHLGNLVFDH